MTGSTTGSGPRPTSTVPTTHRQSTPEPTGWVGMVYFAGAMLLMVGVFEAVNGLVALFKDDLYLVRPTELAVNVDFTAWGWTHLLIGILLVVVGFAVIVGQRWAQWTAVALAVFSAVANFAFIPAYPVWSLLIITLDVLAIYAVAAHGREVDM
jgi:hypothetical protein